MCACLQSPNILLGRDYTAKIADVGLAKLMMRDCLSTLRDVRTQCLVCCQSSKCW